MTSYDNTDTKVLQYDSSKETAGAAHLDEIHATRNDKMKEIAASMVGQTGNKAENEKAARSRHKSVFQETRADGSVETVTRETKIVDVHLGEITPELAAKRKRQAKRLRKHWQVRRCFGSQFAIWGAKFPIISDTSGVPVLQFGAPTSPMISNTSGVPVLQFGAPTSPMISNTSGVPVLQFGAPTS
eukprot:SAG31_NODE_1037_length_10221_cov_4.564019_11_plen_185_part_01